MPRPRPFTVEETMQCVYANGGSIDVESLRSLLVSKFYTNKKVHVNTAAKALDELSVGESPRLVVEGYRKTERGYTKRWWRLND